MTTTIDEPGRTDRFDDVLGDVKIIDCDAHFTEPADLWTSRVPASMRDRVPVQETVDGIPRGTSTTRCWASTGGNTIRTGREKVLGAHVVQPFDQIDPSAWDVKERLELIDDMGIHAQILYPNGIGFASNHVFAIEDMAQRTLVLQIYNDFSSTSSTSRAAGCFPRRCCRSGTWT